MKLTFLGGADEVGASSTLIEIDGKCILVDCGIRPSPKARDGLAGDQLPNLDQIARPDAILVTHAHTDHTGALELVTDRFPDVPVYATPPTIALTRVLHQDARRIMQSRLDTEGELPLFDDVSVQRLMSALVPVPYLARVTLGEGLAVTFFPAGHIAGAAMLGLESAEGNLLLTGDFSISPQRTVDGARPPAFHPDIMVVESTYGGRLHANRLVQERKLLEAVAGVVAVGGKVLIPAFALGRAQEILLILGEGQRRGELPPVPVWADGMVRTICQAYTSFAEVLPLALQERGATFFGGQIQPVQTAEQRNALIWQPGAAVIVASSGMLAGGPALLYAKAFAGVGEHAILLTGYQDEESPGRRLQELAEKGRGTLRFGNEKVDVQCRLGTYSLSAHADEGQVISLIETLDPGRVILVHGDDPARSSLEKALEDRQRLVHLPRGGQNLEFKFEHRKPVRGENTGADFRARQLALLRERQRRLQGYADSVGKWLLLKGDVPVPVRCLALEVDHLWVEITPGLEQAAYPEEVQAVLGDVPPTPADLAAIQPPPPAGTMEPNQAMAYASRQLPPTARLRKVGYRLNEQTLVLTFDFPAVAGRRFADTIAALSKTTGWLVEVAAEPNQGALNTFLREILPGDWELIKSPAIHREQQRIVAAVRVPQPGTGGAVEALCAQYLAETGFTLELVVSAAAATPVVLPVAWQGERLEINAAYALIKSSLEGSTLYRTSLKGAAIMLSFISPQVGERYRQQIDDLALQVGWPLTINPQPNQGSILETARALMAAASWQVVKGPGIYPDRAEVTVSVGSILTDEEIAECATDFEDQTGYHLVVQAPRAPASGLTNPNPSPDIQVIEIPLERIRLKPAHAALELDPAKLDKAIDRARRMGIAPPIQVRRTRTDYVLVDGLYRLRAAQALKLTKIPAIVE
ncbi:MAG TPA: MBL fold metallo-hydrolase [Anaerolineaceae bacterium]|nr:MBL fold metallo-hydrolase [Anaerolineaceae bacterium]